MSKKSGSKQSALQRLSHNMNSILVNTGTKRRKLSPNVKQGSYKKLKLKPDPTSLFKRFKFDINEKENHDVPLNSNNSTLKSDNQKPKTVLKTWTPPLKINNNSEKIFDKLQNTERSIGISNKVKSEINKRKVPSVTVTTASIENVDVSDENLDGTLDLFYDIKEINECNKKKELQDSITKISQSQTDKLNVLSGNDSIANKDCFEKETVDEELNLTADTSIKLLHDTASNFNIPEDNLENKDQHVTVSNNCNETINKYKNEILPSFYDSDNKLDNETNDIYNNSTNKNLNEIFTNKVSPNKNIEMKSKDSENLFLMKELQLKSQNIIHQDVINEVDEVQVQDNDKINKSIVNLNKNYTGLEFTPEINKPEEKFFETFNDIISQQNSQMISINGNKIEKENNFIFDKDNYDAEFNYESSQKTKSLDNKHKIEKSDDEEFFFTCVNDNINLETDHEKISHEINNLNSQNTKTCYSERLIVNEFNVSEKEKKASYITTETNSMIDEKQTDLLRNNEIKEIQETLILEQDSECTLLNETSTSSILLHENSDKNFSKSAKKIDIYHTQESDNNGIHNQFINNNTSLVLDYDDINENIHKSQVIINEDQIVEANDEETCNIYETASSVTNDIKNNNDVFNHEMQPKEGQIILSQSDNDKDSQETNLQLTDDSREANINELINNKVDKLIIDENIEECDNDLSNDKISDKNKIIEEKYKEMVVNSKYKTSHSITNDNLNNHYNDSQPEECEIISLNSDESKNSQESCLELIKDNENEQKMDELINIKGIKKEKYDDLIEGSDDFYDIQMSEVIRIENEYTKTKMNFSKQTDMGFNENTYQTFNRSSNISSTSNAYTGDISKKVTTPNKNMNAVNDHDPVIPPRKLEWVQKMNEDKQKLRSIIQEINKLNNIVLQARKQLWPHQFNNQ